MYTNITPRAKAKIYDLAKEARVLTQQQMEFMISVFRDFQKRDTTEIGGVEVPIPDDLGYHNQGYMAVAPVYGSTSLDENPTWFPERFTEVRPWDWYMGEMEVTEADENYPIGGTTPVGKDLAADGGLHRCPALRRAAG